MACHAHHLCAHCVIAIHCRLNCSTPPLCPKKPPRLTTVLVAWSRRRQRRTVAAAACLALRASQAVVICLLTIDSFDSFHIDIICGPGPGYRAPPFGKCGPAFRSTLRLLRCSRLDPPAAFARPVARNATRWPQGRRCCAVLVPTVMCQAGVVCGATLR